MNIVSQLGILQYSVTEALAKEGYTPIKIRKLIKAIYDNGYRDVPKATDETRWVCLKIQSNEDRF